MGFELSGGAVARGEERVKQKVRGIGKWKNLARKGRSRQGVGGEHVS